MNPQSHQKELILASSSPYRRVLLARYCLPFTTQDPAIDENPLPGEATVALTQRLAMTKAESVAAAFPMACVIGSDQLAEFSGGSLGKPQSEAAAVAQLLKFSEQSVYFHTSAAVVCKSSDFVRLETVTTQVQFRRLNEGEVRRYIAQDQPLDCAGAFRSEAAGPTLLRAMISDDPTAIIGLPLIALAEMLREAGFSLP